jgi:hypothetical protein
MAGSITAFQGYLRDVVKQTDQFRKQGSDREEARRRLTSQRMQDMFPATARPGAELRHSTHLRVALRSGAQEVAERESSFRKVGALRIVFDR